MQNLGLREVFDGLADKNVHRDCQNRTVNGACSIPCRPFLSEKKQFGANGLHFGELRRCLSRIVDGRI